MQTNLTLRDGRKLRLNTPEEEAQITAGIAQDPDTHVPTDAEWAQFKPLRGRPPVAVKRPMLSIRVDPDIAAALRASGKGWQTRVNALLRQAVEQGRLQA
ncbi:MAG: hypothetical protein FD135_1774 [Comamonadaceae bacterium]|nr:MAG: hypothetical protein FD135_1774 [Comamonadaceae bacterium]